MVLYAGYTDPDYKTIRHHFYVYVKATFRIEALVLCSGKTGNLQYHSQLRHSTICDVTHLLYATCC